MHDEKLIMNFKSMKEDCIIVLLYYYTS